MDAGSIPVGSMVSPSFEQVELMLRYLNTADLGYPARRRVDAGRGFCVLSGHRAEQLAGATTVSGNRRHPGGRTVPIDPPVARQSYDQLDAWSGHARSATSARRS